MSDLSRFEAVLDASGVAARVETLLPLGVRPRQLPVRTLLLGMLLGQAEGRPAHLVAVHRRLCELGQADQRRLGVLADWRGGLHGLTYRQTEYLFSRIVAVLGHDAPDGAPGIALQEVLDAIVEASVAGHDETSRSLAVDWTDVESFSTRRHKANGAYADPDASWGHRRGGGPGEKSELFFGFYLSLATMVREDRGPAVPELVRTMTLTSPERRDQVPVFVSVLTSMAAGGVPLGDVVADSGYAHRRPEHVALPLRAHGAELVIDLHPHDRGTQGTHRGAISWNGNLYCPKTPAPLFGIGPLSRGASAEEVAAQDAASAELARYKLGRIAGPDADGYGRVGCPAAAAKLRCPLRAASMDLPFDRPEIDAPPEHPPPCCTQVTITVPPSVNAKTAQKHDYPSKTHRRSYARRSAAERSNARIKDPATIDVARGWCRVMGLVAMSLFLGCAVVVRNLAVGDAFEARHEDDRRRGAEGRPGRTRRRRRVTLNELAGTTGASP